MRPLTVTFYVNDGTPSLSTSQSVEAKVVSLGRLSGTLDEQLTKISPSDFTVQLADDDEVVWNWLQTQLQTTQDGVSQLFPPWLVVYLGSVNVFTGLVDLSSLRRDYGSRMIDVSAQNWSVMLANISLAGTQREMPRRPGLRGSADLGTGGTIYVLGWAHPSWVYFAHGTDIRKGDFVTTDKTGVQQFKVRIGVGSFGGLDGVAIEGWNWASRTSGPYRFTRVANALESLPGFTAQSGVLSGNSVKLDTVEGLTPGDSLQAVGGSEILITDIDTERRTISSAREITGVKTGTLLYLSAESVKFLTNQKATALAQLVALPYEVNTDRYTPSPLVRALFGYLTNENIGGQDLYHPSDIEPTTTGVRVICEDGAFSGTPETGYVAAGDWGTRYVDWTCQQTTAPTLGLMPDDAPAISGSMGVRNRVFYTWTWNHEQYVEATPSGGLWAWVQSVVLAYTARTKKYPAKCVGYDYSQSRRIVITNPDSGSATFSEQRWTGTAWTAATTGTWPVANCYPCQLAPMPGVAATTGPVSPQGQAMLALTYGGGTYALQLVWAGAVVTLAVDATIAAGAVLCSTPWGVYLVGPGGYGRVTLTDGALVLHWGVIGDPRSAILIPNTFAAIDEDSVYCFLRIDYADPDDQTKVLTETRLLNLTTLPDPSIDPVLFSQRVMPGAPRIARAFRDPSDTDRLIGILGSRLFRISTDPPQVIERMSVDAMTGMEALEHIGQFLNALVVPRGLGLVDLVSRNQAGTAAAVTVDRVSVLQSRISPHFFSVVRVSSQDDTLYADAYGPVVGGKALEISGTPTTWTEAGCYGLASNLAAFLGTPRRMEEQTWCWEDANSAPPWEALAWWSPFTVNGGATVWLLAGMDYDLIKGETKMTLVERV